MSNKFRGEATLVGPEREEYLLVFDANAFAQLETEWDKSMKGCLDYIGTWNEDNFRMSDLITLLWASLWRNHKMQREEVGDLLSSMDREAVTTALMLAVERAGDSMKKDPKPGEAPAPGKAPARKPAKKRNGTGTGR